MTLQEPRVLSKNLTLQYKKVIYQIQTQRPSYTLRQATVTVCENSAGEITILYKGQPLSYTIYQRQERQSEVTPPKLIERVLPPTAPKERKPRYIPPPDHPWRRFEFGANAKPQSK